MKMQRKRFTVTIDVLDETIETPADPKPGQNMPLTSEGLSTYLQEMLEVPQHPMNEEGQGYYLVGIQVEAEVVPHGIIDVTEETTDRELSDLND